MRAFRALSFAAAAVVLSVPASAAPTVSLSAPVSNSKYLQPATVTVSANATASSGTTLTTVEFYAGSSLIGADTTSPYSVNWANAPAGSHSLTAKVYDNTGAVTTSAARTISVSATNTVPTISLSSPANNASYLSPASITVSATAKAPEVNDTIARVEFYVGTTHIGTDTTSPYSVKWASPPVGVHSLTAKTWDGQGAMKTSGARSVTVTTTNTPPTVALSAPANNASYLSPASITVSATAKAPEANDTIARVEFYAGTTSIGTDTTSPYSVKWASAPAGVHSLTAKTWDGQGAVTTSAARTITVGVSNVPPAITALNATPQTLNDTATSQLQVVASDTDAGPAPLSYAWSIVSGGGSLSGSTAANPVYTPANVSIPTSAVINVTVSDGAASVNQSITLTVNDTPVATETIVYYHNDALGSPIAATDATGNLLWRESYRPYGERLNNAPGAATNPIWYTGKRQDPETGLVYMGARYYNPALGRFLSIDPVEPDENNLHSLNRYAYANNNPYKFTDPDGQVAETVIDIISLGLSINAFRQDPSFVNGLAVAYDGLATAVPFLPGGIGIIRQAATKGSDVTQAVKQAADRGAAKAGEGAQKRNQYGDLASAQRRKHILDGDSTGGGHRPGTGKPGKSEFPKGWSDDKIMHEISDVATDPSSAVRPTRGGRTISEGTRDGVRIRVIHDRNGDIVSGYPINVQRNPK